MDPSVDVVPVRPSNRLACWTTGLRPGPDRDAVDGQHVHRRPCDVR